MENQEPTAKFSLNYGVILGLILVLIHVVMYITGMLVQGEQWPMYIYYLIFPVVILFGISSYKKKNNNFLTLGQALKLGVAIAALSGLVYGIYNALFYFIIEPEFFDQMIEVTRDKLLETPNMTEQQVEMTIEWTKKLGGPVMGGAVFILFSTIFGFIYSLIGGLVMQKKEPLF